MNERLALPNIQLPSLPTLPVPELPNIPTTSLPKLPQLNAGSLTQTPYLRSDYSEPSNNGYEFEGTISSTDDTEVNSIADLYHAGRTIEQHYYDTHGGRTIGNMFKYTFSNDDSDVLYHRNIAKAQVSKWWESHFKSPYTNIKHGFELAKTDEVAGKALRKAGRNQFIVNNLVALGDTMDELGVKYIKAIMPAGITTADQSTRGTGVAGVKKRLNDLKWVMDERGNVTGRSTYDYNVNFNGDRDDMTFWEGFTNFVLDIVLDPSNWISFGSKSLASSSAKAGLNSIDDVAPNAAKVMTANKRAWRNFVTDGIIKGQDDALDRYTLALIRKSKDPNFKDYLSMTEYLSKAQVNKTTGFIRPLEATSEAYSSLKNAIGIQNSRIIASRFMDEMNSMLKSIDIARMDATVLGSNADTLLSTFKSARTLNRIATVVDETERIARIITVPELHVLSNAIKVPGRIGKALSNRLNKAITSSDIQGNKMTEKYTSALMDEVDSMATSYNAVVRNSDAIDADAINDVLSDVMFAKTKVNLSDIHLIKSKALELFSNISDNSTSTDIDRIYKIAIEDLNNTVKTISNGTHTDIISYLDSVMRSFKEVTRFNKHYKTIYNDIKSLKLGLSALTKTYKETKAFVAVNDFRRTNILFSKAAFSGGSIFSKSGRRIDTKVVKALRTSPEHTATVLSDIDNLVTLNKSLVRNAVQNDLLSEAQSYFKTILTEDSVLTKERVLNLEKYNGALVDAYYKLETKVGVSKKYTVFKKAISSLRTSGDISLSAVLENDNKTILKLLNGNKVVNTTLVQNPIAKDVYSVTEKDINNYISDSLIGFLDEYVLNIVNTAKGFSATKDYGLSNIADVADVEQSAVLFKATKTLLNDGAILLSNDSDLFTLDMRNALSSHVVDLMSEYTSVDLNGAIVNNILSMPKTEFATIMHNATIALADAIMYSPDWSYTASDGTSLVKLINKELAPMLSSFKDLAFGHNVSVVDIPVENSIMILQSDNTYKSYEFIYDTYDKLTELLKNCPDQINTSDEMLKADIETIKEIHAYTTQLRNTLDILRNSSMSPEKTRAIIDSLQNAKYGGVSYNKFVEDDLMPSFVDKVNKTIRFYSSSKIPDYLSGSASIDSYRKAYQTGKIDLTDTFKLLSPNGADELAVRFVNDNHHAFNDVLATIVIDAYENPIEFGKLLEDCLQPGGDIRYIDTETLSTMANKLNDINEYTSISLKELVTSKSISDLENTSSISVKLTDTSTMAFSSGAVEAYGGIDIARAMYKANDISEEVTYSDVAQFIYNTLTDSNTRYVGGFNQVAFDMPVINAFLDKHRLYLPTELPINNRDVLNVNYSKWGIDLMDDDDAKYLLDLLNIQNDATNGAPIFKIGLKEFEYTCYDVLRNIKNVDADESMGLFKEALKEFIDKPVDADDAATISKYLTKTYKGNLIAGTYWDVFSRGEEAMKEVSTNGSNEGVLNKLLVDPNVYHPYNIRYLIREQFVPFLNTRQARPDQLDHLNKLFTKVSEKGNNMSEGLYWYLTNSLHIDNPNDIKIALAEYIRRLSLKFDYLNLIDLDVVAKDKYLSIALLSNLNQRFEHLIGGALYFKSAKELDELTDGLDALTKDLEVFSKDLEKRMQDISAESSKIDMFFDPATVSDMPLQRLLSDVPNPVNDRLPIEAYLADAVDASDAFDKLKLFTERDTSLSGKSRLVKKTVESVKRAYNAIVSELPDADSNSITSALNKYKRDAINADTLETLTRLTSIEDTDTFAEEVLRYIISNDFQIEYSMANWYPNEKYKTLTTLFNTQIDKVLKNYGIVKSVKGNHIILTLSDDWDLMYDAGTDVVDYVNKNATKVVTFTDFRKTINESVVMHNLGAIDIIKNAKISENVKQHLINEFTTIDNAMAQIGEGHDMLLTTRPFSMSTYKYRLANLSENYISDGAVMSSDKLALSGILGHSNFIFKQHSFIPYTDATPIDYFATLTEQLKYLSNNANNVNIATNALFSTPNVFGPEGLLKAYINDPELPKLINDNNFVCLTVSKANKKFANALGYQVKPVYIDSLKDIEYASKLPTCIMVPYDDAFYYMDYINNAREGVTGLEKFLSKKKALYAAGELSSARVWFSNPMDGVLKASIVTGHNPMEFVARMPGIIKDYNDYGKLYKKVAAYTGNAQLTATDITRYYNKFPDTAMPVEIFRYYHELNSNKLIGDNTMFMDALNDTVANKKLSSKLSEMAFKGMSSTERLVRTAMYQVLEEDGLLKSDIFKLIGKSQFDYSNKSLATRLIEFFIPYYTYQTKNLFFWTVDAVQNNLASKCLIKGAKEKYRSWNTTAEELNSNLGLLYHVQNGNIQINDGLVLKINPSYMDAYNFLFNPIDGIYDMLHSPTQAAADSLSRDGAARVMLDAMFGGTDEEVGKVFKAITATDVIDNAANMLPVSNVLYNRFFKPDDGKLFAGSTAGKNYARIDNKFWAVIGAAFPSLFGSTNRWSQYNRDQQYWDTAHYYRSNLFRTYSRPARTYNYYKVYSRKYEPKLKHSRAYYYALRAMRTPARYIWDVKYY